jgi:hypothetical protein
VTFKANLAGAQVAQTIGPLRQVLRRAGSDKNAQATERFLLLTQANSDAPELIQSESSHYGPYRAASVDYAAQIVELESPILAKGASLPGRPAPLSVTGAGGPRSYAGGTFFTR